MLEQGILSFSDLQFMVPGTHADLTGQYSLDGKTFDFRGNVKLKAKLSRMTTGWKSLLLSQWIHFFKSMVPGRKFRSESPARGISLISALNYSPSARP